MSATRQRQLEDLQQASGCEVDLVLENDLERLELSSHPFHAGFELLTIMHQADYMRAYLMAHHGGGYSDIKAPTASWLGAFAELDQDPSLDVIGYRIPHHSHAARLGLPARWVVADRRMSPALMIWKLGWWRHLRYRISWRSLMGAGAFVMKPGSPFARAYLETVDAALDKALPDLERGAAFLPDGTRRLGKETYYGLDGYPFRWISLANDILHPLCLRYGTRVQLSLPPPNLSDYR